MDELFCYSGIEFVWWMFLFPLSQVFLSSWRRSTYPSAAICFGFGLSERVDLKAGLTGRVFGGLIRRLSGGLKAVQATRRDINT